MDKLKQATEYFKNNEGFNRLFNGIKEKYISFGDIKGNVVISKPSQIEKQALSGLMKKDYSKNNMISINLKKVQQRLDESKFEGVDLLNLLKEYYKQEILTKKEKQEKKQNEFELFLQEILKEIENTYIYNFLLNSIEKKDNLYLSIKRYYKIEKNSLKYEILNVCKGINYLNDSKIDEKIRIPVFASKITSNPHGFDKNKLGGKLLILFLCYINKLQYSQNSEFLAELYYNNNLLIDDVSNMVLCKNIIGYKNDEIHKGLAGFNEYNEPIYLNLYNLSNINYVRMKNKKIFVTENPAVFMGIVEKCKVKNFPLVCTYGQVKLAGIMLLDLLVKQNNQIFYSGDLDPEGIQIADKLKQRYKGHLTLIGFEADIYYKNLSDVKLNDSRLKKLNNIKSEELQKICNHMKNVKKASYEEENIEFLVEFIEKFNNYNRL